MQNQKSEFLKLYEPIHESFVRFCNARAYGLMEVEDLVSESVLQALEKFSQLKNKEAFTSYLFSIAKNIINNKYRRVKFKGSYKENEINLIPDEGIDTSINYDIEVLYQMLNRLPKKQEEALILFEISGFSIKEVAKIQNSTESAVKQRLKRGREFLAVLFKSDQLKYENTETQSSIIMSVFL